MRDHQSVRTGVAVDLDPAAGPLLATDPMLPPDPLADSWLNFVLDPAPDDCSLELLLAADDEDRDPAADEQLTGWPATLHDAAADLESTAPGPLLAVLLDETDLDCCADDQLVAAAAAAARLESWAAARKLSAAAALVARAAGWRGVARDSQAVPGLSVAASKIAAHELGAALDLSPRSAGNVVHLALDLARLPVTRAALAGGPIDLPKARMVVDTLRVLDDDSAREVEGRVLPAASGRTWAQLHATLRRAVLRVDPAAAAERRRRSVCDRKAEWFPLPDGMAGITWTDTAEKVDSFWIWLTATAEAARGADDDRTLDQTRADVLGDLGRLGLDGDTTHPDHLAGVQAGALTDGGQPGQCRDERHQPEQCQPEQCQPEQCQPEQCQPEQCQPEHRQPEHRRDERRRDEHREARLGQQGHDLTRPDEPEPSEPEPSEPEPSEPEPSEQAAWPTAATAVPARRAGRGRPGRLPLRQGRRPQVQVVVGIGTLLGLDEQPGELVGYGPITADVARRIAADGTWRRILTDPRTGRFDEMSLSTYEPPQDLRDHLVARDRTCRGPGCRMPADRSDLDHRVPHPRGPTSPDNLYAACRAFHEDKTLTDTTVTGDGAGGLFVTYPTGRTYYRPADPVLDDALDLTPAEAQAPAH